MSHGENTGLIRDVFILSHNVCGRSLFYFDSTRVNEHSFLDIEKNKWNNKFKKRRVPKHKVIDPKYASIATTTVTPSVSIGRVVMLVDFIDYYRSVSFGSIHSLFSAIDSILFICSFCALPLSRSMYWRVYKVKQLEDIVNKTIKLGFSQWW